MFDPQSQTKTPIRRLSVAKEYLLVSGKPLGYQCGQITNRDSDPLAKQGIVLGAFEMDLAFQTGSNEHFRSSGTGFLQPFHLDTFANLPTGAPATGSAAQAGL
jgi:hypothetical protein